MGVFTVGRQVSIEILMPGWWLSGSSIDLDFRNARYYDSSVPNTVPVVTSYLSCTRASTGYAKDSSGTWIAFASNQLRITDLGLLVENASTNNLINSATPATQTTASLAADDYTLWVEGSGSALASAGSATITGAASATQDNPDTFTVTVGGTVTVTVTGSLTRFQLESGSFASSFILTTGAAATRAADAVTVTGNLNTLLTTLPQSFVLDTKTSQAILSNNFVGMLVDVADGAPGVSLEPGVGQPGTWSSNTFEAGPLYTLGSGSFVTGAKTGVAQDSGGISLVGNAGTVATSGSTQTVFPSGAGLGRGNSRNATELIRRATFWNSKLADATLQALTAP